jgi:hypothetical protein
VFDVVAKGLKAGPQARNGVHHTLGQWTERRQSFAQARDDHVEAPQIGFARAFRAVAQALAGMLLGTFPQGLDEQVRVADQTVAGGVARSLVMHEPAAQRAGGQRRVEQCRKHSLGVCGVVAHQRGHHAGGCPARQPALAHRRESRVGEPAEQLQAPAHPAGITPAAAGELVLRQRQTMNQLAHQQRLLDRREGPALAARQHAEQGLGQAARPALDPRGIAAEAAQRRDTPIAIDQDQALAAATGLRRGGERRNARHNLAPALDRTGDPLHRARLHQAGARKTQLQAMQIKIKALGVHAGKASSARLELLSRPLFANLPLCVPKTLSVLMM